MHRTGRISARSTSGLLVLVFCLIAPVGEVAQAAAPAYAGAVAETEGALNGSSLGDCGGAPEGGRSGKVWVSRMPDDRVVVKVQVRDAEPNATYQINVSCSGAIGTLQTDGRGRGTVTLAPTDAWNLRHRTSFAIDLHVAGPPYADPKRSTPISLPLAS